MLFLLSLRHQIKTKAILSFPPAHPSLSPTSSSTPTFWQPLRDGGPTAWHHRIESFYGQKMKGWESERMRGILPRTRCHSSTVCSEIVLSLFLFLSPTHLCRLCFLISLFKGEQCGPYQNKYGSLDRKVGPFCSKEATVVLTGGGWNSLALQRVCHSALCLRHAGGLRLLSLAVWT